MNSNSTPPASGAQACDAGVAVLRVLEARWNAAAAPWTPQALAANYSEDALLFAGLPGHFIGRGAILGYFQSYAGIIVRATLGLVDQHVAALAPDVFLAQGYGEFRFELADGRDTRSRLRTTWILARRDGAWQIAQHHFSTTPDKPPIE